MSIFISILCSNQHGSKSVYFLLSNSGSNPSCLQFYFFFNFQFLVHKLKSPQDPRSLLKQPKQSLNPRSLFLKVQIAKHYCWNLDDLDASLEGEEKGLLQTEN